MSMSHRAVSLIRNVPCQLAAGAGAARRILIVSGRAQGSAPAGEEDMMKKSLTELVLVVDRGQHRQAYQHLYVLA